MKTTVDADTCTGCELCVDICPEVFEMGDEVAEVIGEEVPATSTDTCREAAEKCPVEAISIDE